jgi:hypothetical protein
MKEIKEHMEVIGADGVHIGTVDKIEGGRIKLMKEGQRRRQPQGPSPLHRQRPRRRRRRRQGSALGQRERGGDDGKVGANGSREGLWTASTNKTYDLALATTYAA